MALFDDCIMSTYTVRIPTHNANITPSHSISKSMISNRHAHLSDSRLAPASRANGFSRAATRARAPIADLPHQSHPDPEFRACNRRRCEAWALVVEAVGPIAG